MLKKYLFNLEKLYNSRIKIFLILRLFLDLKFTDHQLNVDFPFRDFFQDRLFVFIDHGITQVVQPLQLDRNQRQGGTSANIVVVESDTRVDGIGPHQQLGAAVDNRPLDR